MKTKGIVIWPYSECRSTMATYAAIATSIDVPTYIAILRDNNGCGMANRSSLGFDANEFSNLDRTFIGLNLAKGLDVIRTHPGWDHIFCEFQNSSVTRQLIVKAKETGGRIIIACESPCNMYSGWKWFAKEIYLRSVVPRICRKIVSIADVFINYSGNDAKAHKFCKWPDSQIFPFGYYSPRIQGSQRKLRVTGTDFRILASGKLSKYRGADVLVNALILLKEWGVNYSATITQDGPLFDKIRRIKQTYNLPLDLPGYLPLKDMVHHYENCSVYVGAGRSEPWGMRLNDALNCGAPLVVSDGMGGEKLVQDYGCGLICKRNNPRDLAEKLRILAQDAKKYNEIALRAYEAAEEIVPEKRAMDIIEVLIKVGWI